MTVMVTVGDTVVPVGDELVRIPMSWEQFLATDIDVPSEYYGGALVIRGIAGKRHQQVLGRVFIALTQSAAPGVTVLSECGWSPDGVREALVPDVIVFVDTPGSDPDEPFVGVPRLVVEVLSTNRRDDLVAKLYRYAGWGALDYWVIDPRDRVLLTYRLRDGSYVETARASRGTLTVEYADTAVDLDLDTLLAD